MKNLNNIIAYFVLGKIVSIAHFFDFWGKKDSNKMSQEESKGSRADQWATQVLQNLESVMENNGSASSKKHKPSRYF